MAMNLDIYNKLKEVPSEYLKQITGGRLKGMSDIKPQWRIMKITEQFGACGFGWKIQNVNFSYETKGDEIVCNCSLEFLYKVGKEWSEPVLGFGGAMFSTVERNGIFVSDEAQKMAYTDAISVATKMIGLASNVYMGHGSKYDNNTLQRSEQPKISTPIGIVPSLIKVVAGANDIDSLNKIWSNNVPLHDSKEFVKLIAIKRIEFASRTEDLSKIFDDSQILHADADFVSTLTAKKKVFSNKKQQSA